MPQSSIRAKKKKTLLPLSELVDVLAELKTGKIFFFLSLAPLHLHNPHIFPLLPPLPPALGIFLLP